MLKRLYRTVRRTIRGVRPTGTDWHRAAVGGMWDEIGALQFAFVRDHGLRPDHYLLDVGCGSLRGGVHFIQYLEAGHYFGIEHDGPTLDAGRDVELPRYGIVDKDPQLFLIDDFDLTRIPAGIEFDFMLAQSLFTHLTPEWIDLCVGRVTPRLRTGGAFFATFELAENDVVDAGKPHRWRPNERRGTHYPFRVFEQIAERHGLTAKYIGSWGHPRDQKMLVFRHRA